MYEKAAMKISSVGDSRGMYRISLFVQLHHRKSAEQSKTAAP